MKLRQIARVGGVLGACLLMFIFGNMWASRNITKYEGENTQGLVTSLVFPVDLPMYGIPLIEYHSVLLSLRKGDLDEAIPRLEAFLDLAVFEAMQRRKILTGEDLAVLDKGLMRVANYRKEFPRPITQDDATEVRDFKNRIDTFLRNF
jgi:hypothetical protein